MREKVTTWEIAPRTTHACNKPRATAAAADDAPPAPDLVDAIRAARGVAPQQAPTVASRSGDVPEPPCLATAIRERRALEGRQR